MHETLCDILQPILDTDLEGKIQIHSGECDSFIFSNRTKDLINDLLKLQEEKRLFVSIKIENDRCRSTSAKPADKRSPQQRTSQVHRKGNRTVPNLLPELKKLMTLYHVSLIVCTYMGTYIYVPPLMHRNTNSLRRWHVVATCHPTLFQS